MSFPPYFSARLGIVLTVMSPLVQALFYGGGLTILSQNVLDGAQNNGSAAILIHQQSQHSAASTACELLGETLWNPDTQDFYAGLNNSLTYQAFQGLVPANQLYWIFGSMEDVAAYRGIDANGTVHYVDGLTELPALCTQSAPVSNTSVSNSSAEWQVIQPVDDSQFTGFRDYHTWKFRGVRYAKKPERFTYSQIYLEPGEVNATTAGADCVQPIGEVKSGSSEDCLFLNIWTPHLPRSAGATKTELKPVMVYYYGGGYTSGSGKNPNTDGTNLASRGDVVVVSVNYRVGTVGFLAFNDGIHNGNYAISDMTTSLEWINKYIQYFGGDSSRVTVFGESAGAGMTHIALASPKAKGLFQRAIMQSDPDGYPSNGKLTWSQYPSIGDSYKDSTIKVLNKTGCLNATDPVACLNTTSGFDLVNLSPNVNSAVNDGTYLTNHELVVNSTGIASDVDVITGTNRNEEGIDMDAFPQNGTNFTAYFSDFIKNHWGFNPSLLTPTLQKLPPASAPNAPDKVLNLSISVATDVTFTCLDLAKAYSAAKHGAFKSTYSYIFNRTYSPSGYTKTWCDAPRTNKRPHGDPDGEYYKCHGGEQLIVFGNELRAGQPDRDGLDVPFMQLVIDYWSAFARTGNPNPAKDYLLARGHYGSLAQIEATGTWDPVNATKPRTRLLQWNGGQVPFPNGTICDLLDAPVDVFER